MPGLDPGIHREKAAGESPPFSVFGFSALTAIRRFTPQTYSADAPDF
jgi:hypothetical protein